MPESNERRIFFLCPEASQILGGVKKIYQHVDILNRSGIKAYVLHATPGFRYMWFQNETEIAYPCWPSGVKHFYPGNLELFTKNERIPAINVNDIVVVPEIFAFEFVKVSFEQPYVIFSQNAYYTFNTVQWPMGVFNLDQGLKDNPYNSPYLLGVVVISADNRNFIQYCFSNVPVYRLHNSVNSKKFSFSLDKTKQIACIPTKKPHDIHQLIGILMSRGKLRGWSFVPINNKSEDEVAEILKKSWMFLSSGSVEGFSLPPMEAILCGCIVIGYHGQGGKEYIHPPLVVQIESENILEFAKQVESIAAEIDRNPQEMQKKAEQNCKTIKSLYSQEQEEKDILEVWNTLFSVKK